MTKPKKLFFLVISKDYFYCVPAKDLKTVGDIQSVAVNDEVSFKYSSLSLVGTVRFISSDEEKVLSAIRAEKKAIKRRDSKSFHESSPRKCTLKAKRPTDEVKVKQENHSKSKAKMSEKREKERAKARAEHLTEQDIISSRDTSKQDDVAQSSPKSDDGQSSSGSSIDTSTKKADLVHAKEDINKIKMLDDASFDGGNSIHRASTMIAASSNDSNVNMIDEQSSTTKQTVEDELNSTVPVSDVDSESNKRKGMESDSSELDGRVSKRARVSSSSDSSDVSSSSSDSSSESSSTESSSTSSSNSDSEESNSRKKKRVHKKKSKKRHHRKSKKNSKKNKKRSKKKSKKKASDKGKIKRNLDIYPGPNYKHKSDDVGVVRLHTDFDVYVLKTEMESALQSARSPQTFIKLMVRHVYTEEALRGSTAQGYPSRNMGRSKLKQRDVLPRLDPEGRKAILKRAELLENERKSWRPRIGASAMNQAFAQAVGTFN